MQLSFRGSRKTLAEKEHECEDRAEIPGAFKDSAIKKGALNILWGYTREV